MIPRSSPEAEGLDPEAVRRLVDGFDALNAVHGFVLLRDGHVVAEGSWAPYATDRPHMMFSVSKSFTATAVGLAIDDGLFTLDDRVVDLLAPEVPEDPSPHLQAMRVRHLLTMTTGHAISTMEAIDTSRLGRRGGDWVRQILALPVEHEPGTTFVYNTGATYLAGVIVQRLTGQRLVHYLRPRVFEPLGITTATWEQDPDGLDVAGFGLSITTEELAAFGQLCLQRGTWRGRQLVPAAWLDEATAWQVHNGPHDWPEWEQGYGFQFWRCRHGAYRADGAFGQYAIVWPEHNLVLAVTSGIQNLQSVLDAVWAAFLPSLATERAEEPGREPAPEPAQQPGAEPAQQPGAGPAQQPGAGPAQQPGAGPAQEPGAGPAQEPGAAVVSRRSLSTPEGAPSSPREAVLLGVAWPLDPPLGGIQSLTVTRDNCLRLNGCPLGYGEWLPGELEREGRLCDVAGAAAWTDESTLVVRTAWLDGPFISTLTLHIVEDHIDVSLDLNVSFGPTHVGDATIRRTP